jgi:hypothetical protein
MPLPTKDNPKIKYVKKASQWVTTYYSEPTEQNKVRKMVQEWTSEQPNV